MLPDTERMPRWRRVVGAPVMWCVRAVLAGMGFWRVEVAGAVDPAARVVVCNHLSMIEPLALLIATGGATPVTASSRRDDLELHSEDDLCAQLVAMGFDRQKAAVALVATDGDVEEAAMVLSGG